MTKDQLQQELKEKVKPGIKPSELRKSKLSSLNKGDDLKKNKPIKSNEDEGYESDKSDKSIQSPLINQGSITSFPTPPITPNQQIKNLSAEVNSLKKQVEVYKDFKEADLKIKEKLKEQITEYKKTISELTAKIAEQYKSMEELKKQVNYKGSDKESNIQTFNCYHCHKQQAISLLVIELPEVKLCKSCWQEFRKKTKEKAKEAPQTFTCVACDKEKHEVPNYKKVDISYKTHYELIKGKERSLNPFVKGLEYPVCSSCSAYVKEYNEDEGRELDIWE